MKNSNIPFTFWKFWKFGLEILRSEPKFTCLFKSSLFPRLDYHLNVFNISIDSLNMALRKRRLRLLKDCFLSLPF